MKYITDKLNSNIDTISSSRNIHNRKNLKKRRGTKFINKPTPEIEYPEYLYPNTGIVTTKVPENFDYDKELDVVICIPSYERYDLVIRLLNQLYEQPTEHKFQIILLNDGSNDIRYLDLMYQYPKLIYIQNEAPNSKLYHWYCYNQMWDVLRKLNTKFLLQMDDDFLLSENFLDGILKIYRIEHHKNFRVGAISPHLWSFYKEHEFETWWKDNTFADGIALIDIGIIKSIHYKLEPVGIQVLKTGTPVGVWPQISQSIVKVGRVFHRTPNSLVYHSETLESKLHSDLRKDGHGILYTKKYIGEL